MTTVYAVLWVAGLYPVACAWRANRSTSLLHAVGWASVAWFAWGWALLMADADQRGLEPGRYVALCLSGGAGVAVLGARRPHVFAWNFVVVGLLAVMQLPLVESLVIGTDPSDPLRIFFLSATLAVGICNYLPTLSATAVVLLAVVCVIEVLSLFAQDSWALRSDLALFHLLLLLTPWTVWVCWRPRKDRAEFDRVWLDFRDRMGLLWAQRVRDQFNCAAVNAGWTVRLAWRGLHRTAANVAILPIEQDAMLATLRAALKRFGAAV
jgi:hypothetical protein